MKQNINVFITIGVIALVCWQLQGLTRRQFFELDQLKQELNRRYAQGISVQRPDIWLDKNIKIIEQIRKFDPLTATTYQKRQNVFVKRVEQWRAPKEAEARLAQMREVEAERQREVEAKAERKKEAEAEAERQRKAEAERQREVEAEVARKREVEAEARLAQMREVEVVRQREAEAERQKKAEAEAERQRKAEAERQRKAEAERQKEAEAEAERQREAKAERQREVEAKAERKKEAEAEAERKKEAEAEAERKKEAEAVQQIQARIQGVNKTIEDERAKSPDNYDEVSFSEVPNSIAQISRAIVDAQNQFRSIDFKNLQNGVNQLSRDLADAIFHNLIRLSPSIIKYVGDIVNYIVKLQDSNDPFDFDRLKIKNLIEHEITPRLDAAYQQGLLLDPTIYNAVSQDIQENARSIAKNITQQVRKILDKLTVYIRKCNEISKTEKSDKRLSQDHFVATVRAIKAKQDVIDNLYAKLPNIFRNKDIRLLVDDLAIAIAMQEGELSTLKENLYIIYRVRGEAGDKIAILYYGHEPSEDPPGGFYYSDPEVDPLKEIYPHVSLIEAKLLKK